MQKQSRKKIIFIVLIILLILVSGLILYGNIEKVKVKEVTEKYFLLLNSGEIEEAFKLIYVNPEYVEAKNLLKNNYYIYPPQFDLHITSIKKINFYVYNINADLFNRYNSVSEQMNMFVFKINGDRKLALNPYNIPEDYMKNVVIPYNPNLISPNEIIQ